MPLVLFKHDFITENMTYRLFLVLVEGSVNLEQTLVPPCLDRVQVFFQHKLWPNLMGHFFFLWSSHA